MIFTLLTNSVSLQISRCFVSCIHVCVKRNLKSMGISWEEAGELAADRTEWRERVAQCIYDAG